MAFEIPENDQNILFTAAGVSQYDEFGNAQELPEAIVKSYMAYKAIKDRVDVGAMSVDALVYIVLAAGGSRAATLPSGGVQTVASLGRSGEIKHGDPVVVKWRNKKQDATFIGNCGDDEEVIVRLNLDGEERRVPTSTVSVNLVKA